MIASTAPTASCRSPIRPSTARRTKAATWSGNERASLPQVRVGVHGHRGTLLSQGREHARGNSGEETGESSTVRRGQRDGRTHAASAGQGWAGPRLQPLQSDPRRPLSGHEEAGRGRHVLCLSREGDLVRGYGGDQGPVAAARVRQELRRATAARSGTGDAARSSERLPHPAPRRIGGRAHLSRDAVPEGRAALRPGSARRADGHRPRRGVAEADVRRPAPRARAADHSPRPEARERDAGPPSPPDDGGGAERAVVMDFGLAKERRADPAIAKLTATGIILGTPEFMSPEQIRGKVLDARSDIYALGIVAFEMFTGKLPFQGRNAQEMMIARLRSQPVPIRQHRPDVPEPVEKALTKALEANPDARYNTALEFADALTASHAGGFLSKMKERLK